MIFQRKRHLRFPLPGPSALAKVCGCRHAMISSINCLKAWPTGGGSLKSHAEIIEIDVSEAEKMPGVSKVMTAKDVKGTNNLDAPAVTPRRMGSGITEFPVIAGKKICRRGDVMALVAADTEEHAREAAKKVKQHLEELPAYMTFPEAVMPNSIQLHKDLPNYYLKQPFSRERSREDFENAAYVVEGSFTFAA